MSPFQDTSSHRHRKAVSALTADRQRCQYGISEIDREQRGLPEVGFMVGSTAAGTALTLRLTQPRLVLTCYLRYTHPPTSGERSEPPGL